MRRLSVLEYLRFRGVGKMWETFLGDSEGSCQILDFRVQYLEQALNQNKLR